MMGREKKHTRFGNIMEKGISTLESIPIICAIRSGLAMIVPVLLIGSFCLVFQYFPLVQYQEFINHLLDGNVLEFLNLIYRATFGMMSVFLTITVSYSYARSYHHRGGELCSTLTSLICFFILSGVLQGQWDSLGVKGMATAILSAMVGTRLYWLFYDLQQKREKPYMESQDTDFTSAIMMFWPAVCTCILFAGVDLLLIRIFEVDSFFALSSHFINRIFNTLGRGFFSGFLFVLISSFLWFFGIHGSNVLEPVMQELFEPALQTNLDLMAAGRVPAEILSRQFFEVFVLMGGCGTAICLLLSILLFSKRQSNRELSKLAFLPMIFNINELMIFGLPVTFNVILLVPFILTPMVSFVISYTAMWLGLVPVVTSEVNWTIPVIAGGYIATGSVAGSLLQIVNMFAGILIYRPFVLAYDRRRENAMFDLKDALEAALKDSEYTMVPIVLSELPDRRGTMARALQKDIRYSMQNNDMQLYYQPQFDSEWNYIGAEALLRWKHPVFGMMYPSLIIELAKEDGMLEILEERILRQVVKAALHLKNAMGHAVKLSVNVSATTILSDVYMNCLQDLMDTKQILPGEICLEITEQSALVQDERLTECLTRIRDMGYLLAIDDFSMGHTSLAYLEKNHFDVIKLDGNLVRGMEKNHRCEEIIKNIMSLSNAMGFSVLAEYVETREQMKVLGELGCTRYQGYLVSPAIELEALENLIKGK